ncbi:MAG: hypothetical protein ACI4GD_12035 [Lachnospiraceae bacterium]
MFIVLALVAVFIVLFPFKRKAAIEYKNILLDKILWILLLIFFTAIALSLAGFEDTAFYDELVNAFTVFADMNRTYNSESEWYNSETGWLRAYIKAFNIQNISSDFEYQKQVCLDNFDEIFSSTDIGSFYSVEECIRQINDRFLTNFDELSFMIAYRFLEKNGKKYMLPQTGIVKMTTEIDELEKKYSKGQVQQGI